MTGTLDENDVRACDDCHLHGTALRIREAVAEIARLRAELKALQSEPTAQLAMYAAWIARYATGANDDSGYPVRRAAQTERV